MSLPVLLIALLAVLSAFLLGVAVGINWTTRQFKRATDHPIGGRR